MNVFQFSSLFTSHKVVDTFRPLLKDRSIAFIPASYRSWGSEMSWNSRTYYKLGFRSGLDCPIGEKFSPDIFAKALKCDAIHLGGGNTFEFMAMLHLRGLVPYLQEYVHNDGILIGTSAGSIVMGQTIDIAQFADGNYLGLDGDLLNGLGLVEWDIKPHFESWTLHKKEFQDFSNEKGRPLYCLYENQAIHTDDSGIHFLGQVPLCLKPMKVMT